MKNLFVLIVGLILSIPSVSFANKSIENALGQLINQLLESPGIKGKNLELGEWTNNQKLETEFSKLLTEELQICYKSETADDSILRSAAPKNDNLLNDRILPEIVMQLGHSSAVRSVAITRDGKYCITRGDDHTARLWNLRTGQEIRVYKTESEIKNIAISPDGKYLAGAIGEGAQVWDIETGEKVKVLKNSTERITYVAFTSGHLIMGSSNNIGVWDIAAGQLLHSSTANATRLAISDDGKYFATCGREGVLDVWRVPDLSKMRTFDLSYIVTDGRLKYVYKISPRSLSFTKDNKCIMIGGDDKTVRRLDVRTGSLIKIYEDTTIKERNHLYGVLAIVTPDGKKVIVAPHSLGVGGIQIIDALTGQQIKTIDQQGVESIEVSRDGKYLVAGIFDRWYKGYSKLWNLTTGEEIRAFKGHVRPVYSVAITPDGNSIVTGLDYMTRIWDLSLGKLNKTIYHITDYGHVACVSNDGKYLFTGGDHDFSAWMWNLQTGEKIKGFNAGYNVDFLVADADNKSVFTGSYIGGKVHAWDINTGTCTKVFNIPNYGNEQPILTSLAVSRDGKYLLMGLDGGIIETHNLERDAKDYLRVAGDRAWALAFIPDGKYFAAAGDTLCLWDVLTRKEIRRFSGNTLHTRCLAFTNDGKYLVGGGEDHVIRLWDVLTGGEIRSFKGHKVPIRSIAVSSDGKRIISGAEDGMSKIWDIDSGKEIATFLSVETRDYMTMTPDNYYTGTRNAAKYVSWRMGLKMYPFEQFDLRYNRPDIVVNRLGRGSEGTIALYRELYLKRLSKSGFKEQDLIEDFHAPEVTVNTGMFGVEAKNKICNLSFVASDSKYDLKKISIYVNDVPISSPDCILDKNVRTISRNIPIELSLGENKLQVSVQNVKGTESYQETIFVKYSGKNKKENLYIVAIGVSKHKNPDYSLKYAAKDADDIVSLFSGQNSKYENVHILKLTDEKVTKENILSAKNTLKKSNTNRNFFSILS